MSRAIRLSQFLDVSPLQSLVLYWFHLFYKHRASRAKEPTTLTSNGARLLTAVGIAARH
jgi:hypothetical protein